MFLWFLKDVRGNYVFLTAISIDYAELTRQRSATVNALDAAGIATARRIPEGATDTQAKDYAKDFCGPTTTTLTRGPQASLPPT